MKKSIIHIFALTGILISSACGGSNGDEDEPIAEKTFTVSVTNANPEGGEVYVDTPGAISKTVAEGKRVTLVAKPNEGFRFVSWEQDGSSNIKIPTQYYTIEGVYSDASYTAYFEPDKAPDPGEGYTVIFEDQFNQDGRIPDKTKWELCKRESSAWNKHMSESYDQSYVENGRLVLMAEKVNGEYKAGGVRMPDNLGFKYGKVEVSARFSKTARGAWPAIWMMPSQPTWPGWPQCGEIDIMEHLNNDVYIWSVIHSHYTDVIGNTYSPVNQKTSGFKAGEFNTYAIEWSTDAITFFINGEQTLKYHNIHHNNEAEMKQWPFDAPFYLILNHALGGPGTWPGNIDDNQLPAKFEIDCVRISQPTK